MLYQHYLRLSPKYFYFDSKDTVYLLKEDTGEASPVSAEQLERQRIRDLHDELDEISRRAYQMRSDFIRKFNAAKKHYSNIAEFAVRTLMCSGYSSFDDEMFVEMLGLTLGEDEELSFNTVSDMFTATPERVLLVATYCNEGDNERWKYYDWNCKHEENEELDTLYDFLVRIGYQMSDEESALRNGTHELFES